MKALFVFCILVSTLGAEAQEAKSVPEFRLFGGYSYTRGTISPDVNAVNLTFHDMNSKGWHVSAAEQVNRWLGGVVDLSGVYARPFADASLFGAGSGQLQFNNSLYTFTVGPEFTYPRFTRFSPFSHVLVGMANNRLTLPSLTQQVLNQPKLNAQLSETCFSFGAGGGVDVRINRYLASRVQADYLRNNFHDMAVDRQNSFRVSGGLVVLLGVK